MDILESIKYTSKINLFGFPFLHVATGNFYITMGDYVVFQLDCPAQLDIFTPRKCRALSMPYITLALHYLGLVSWSGGTQTNLMPVSSFHWVLFPLYNPTSFWPLNSPRAICEEITEDSLVSVGNESEAG